MHLLLPRTLGVLPALAFLSAALGSQDDEHRGLRVLPELDAEDSWWAGNFLTGDWGGAREELEARGWKLSLAAVADSSWPFDGGNRHRRTDRVLLDVALEVDLERVAGLPRATAFVEFYSLRGRDASMDVGDIQAFSNIDGERVDQLAELWFEQSSADGALRVKAGKVDANSEFAYVDAGLELLHSSAGFSPTIFPLPTYPDPAVSLNLFARPGEGWKVGLGLYNAEDGGAVRGRRGLTSDFEAAFLIGQVDRSWCGGDGRAALGVWHHTGDFDRFDGGTESHAEGMYALLEQRLTREHAHDPTDGQGLTAFLQWGAADDDVSALEEHFGAGLVYTGLVPHRDSWQTGLYLSRADLTDVPAAKLGGRELAVELFQEIRLTPGVTIKPDLQLIVDPSGSRRAEDVWVATLRVELSL